MSLWPSTSRVLFAPAFASELSALGAALVSALGFFFFTLSGLGPFGPFFFRGGSEDASSAGSCAASGSVGCNAFSSA